MSPLPQTIAQGAVTTIEARGGSSLILFFVLVFVLSIPFCWIGAVTGVQLLPGLPVSGLMFVCPVMAAAILLYRDKKARGVTELLKRSFDYKRIRAKAWYIPITLLVPVATISAYGLMRFMRLDLPSPRLSVPVVLSMFLGFFLGALGEELGWSGYAIDPMQARWNALPGSILLGLVWAVWHGAPLLQAHRSPTWIAWWSLYTVASRVLMTWLYNNTGKSVFGATLFHASANLSWQLFPNHGSHWDPRIIGLILALAATIVVFEWGPRRLARCGRDSTV
jgi:uncharacterized protein